MVEAQCSVHISMNIKLCSETMVCKTYFIDEFGIDMMVITQSLVIKYLTVKMIFFSFFLLW